VSKRSLYDILQVSRMASSDVVTIAYQKIKADLGSAAQRGDMDARNEMIFVDEAYAVLSSPVRRRDYDERLAEETAQPVRSASPRMREPEHVAQESGSIFLEWWHSGVTAKLMVAGVVLAGFFVAYQFTGQKGQHRLEERRIDVESVKATGVVDNDAYRAKTERIGVEGTLEVQDKYLDRSYELAKQREDRYTAESEQRARRQQQQEEARRQREEEYQKRQDQRMEQMRQDTAKRDEERQARERVEGQKRELCGIYRSQGRVQEAREMGC